MITTRASTTAEYVFQHARAWSLTRSVPAAAMLLTGIIAALVFKSSLPTILVPLALTMFVHHVLRHYFEYVSVFGYSLAISQGVFSTHTVAFSLWRVHFETTQSFVGRMLGYGSVRVLFEGEWYQFDGIGNFDVLRGLVLHRQNEFAMSGHIVVQHVNGMPNVLRRIK